MTDQSSASPWGEPAAVWSDPTSSVAVPQAPAGKWDPEALAAMGWGAPPRRESWLRKTFRLSRATTGLIIIALGLGVALAAGLGGLVWVIASAIHHAASN